MMSFVDLKSVIEEIPKRVSFHDYLLYKNYKPLKEKNFKGYHCYKKNTEQFDDIIYIGKIKGQEIYHSVHYNDQGNIIDFVKNRIELEDHYQEFTPEKDHLIEACKELIILLNERGQSEMNTSEDTSKNDLKSLMEKSFTQYYNAEILFDHKYLDNLKIKKETVDHEIFNGKIFNSRGLMFNNTFYDVINLAYPIYDINNKECGLYYENLLEIDNSNKTEIEFYASHTVKTGLWISNETKTKTNKTKALTIVDRPRDAIAHFQYIKENRKYASVFNLEEITLNQLIKLTNLGRTKVYLAFNVTMESFIKELRILVSFLAVQHDIKLLQNNTHDVWIHIGYQEKKYYKSFLNKIRIYNNKKAAALIDILGNSSTKYTRKDMIEVSNRENNDLIIKVPKNFKTLYRFEKILIISFPNHIPIQIEKPMHLTWKEQNIKFSEVVNEERTLENYIQNEEVFVLTSN